MKKQKSILALDLGSSYVKLLEFQIDKDKPSIKNFSVTPIPHELQELESINDPSYIDFLKKLISEKGISATGATVCISHPQLEVRNLVLPAMGHKELDTSVRWEAKNIISVPIEEALLDYITLNQLQTDEGKKLQLCVAALPKKLASDYLSLLQALNLEPVSFFIEQQVSWKAFVNSPEIKGKETVALINLGAEKTQVSIYQNAKLGLTRNIPIGGNRFTSSIASKVTTTTGGSIDIEKAESLKYKYGIPTAGEITPEGINPSHISAALRPVLEELSSEINRLFYYYKNEHKGVKDIEIVAIYGGTSNLKGLNDYLSKNLNMPVISPEAVNLESIDIPESYKEELTKQQPFLVNTIGAILTGEEKFINLLPAEIKEKRIIQKQKAMLIKAWLCLVIAIILSYSSLAAWGSLKQRTLTALRKGYEELSPWKAKLDEHRANMRELRRKMAVCNSKIGKEPFWEDLLTELGNLVPANMVLDKIAINYRGKSKKLPLTIAGAIYPDTSPEEETLTKFLEALEKSSYFCKVNLEFSKEAEVEEGKKGLEFEAGCDIK